MPQRSLLIQGQPVENATLELPDHLKGFAKNISVREFRLSARRDAADQLLTIAAGDDELVELQLPEGMRLWMTVADLRRDFGLAQRGGKGPLLVSPNMELRGASRGIGKWLVQGLRLIGIDLVEGAARKIAEKIDGKPLLGLHALPLLASTAALVEKPFPAGDAPVLLFIHGTASSTAGAYGGLWQPAQAEARRRLAGFYQDRCFAFEHKTFGESPIDNALALAQALPVGARLHLVSHSRGGLIGELLCRAMRQDEAGALLAPFDAIDFDALSADEMPVQREKLQALSAELAAKRLRIERFIRVACPARGTTLASGRLDRLLSILATPFQASPSSVLQDLSWLALAVAKERTDPGTLPGLHAQMPDSPLVKLLNRPDVAVAADLRVIAGDYDGDGVLQRIADWASQWFYDGDNDVVVNTPSMYGGAQRRGKAWYYLACGPQVWHCNYFERADSVACLVDGLLSEDLQGSGFRDLAGAPGRTDHIARGAGIELPTPDLRPGEPAEQGSKPLLVLTPGIMGSELYVGQFRVWVDAPSLMLGRFKTLDLDHGRQDVSAYQLMASAYGEIAEHLAASHEVLCFPYDWRKSLVDEGRRLAAFMSEKVLPAAERRKQPVRLLAHSMGGLLVRAAIGLSAKAPTPAQRWWERLKALPTSRFVMAGTPNRGSWLLPCVLTGRENLVSTLAGVDLADKLPCILQIITTFDGFLEMMPDELGRDYFDAATWEALKRADGGGVDWTVPDARRLACSRAARELIDAVAFEPGHMIYLAGQAKDTPTEPQVDAVPGPASQIRFGTTQKGDGRVPWALGIPKDAQPYFIKAVHGDLLATRKAFQGIQELLATGQTTLLSREMPETPEMPAEEAGDMPRGQLPFLPDEAMLVRAALGSPLWQARRAERQGGPRLKVGVCHGDLNAACHPLVVGHYRGDTITSAEAILDQRLGGALSRSMRLGVYPGELNSAEVFNTGADNPLGIVIGLGEVGSLNGARLRQTFTRGLLRLACQYRPAAAETASALAVSALLIGTGSGGIAVRDCIEALIDAACQANLLLADRDTGRVLIDTLEFIEIYEDRALQALRALRELSIANTGADLELNAQLRSGPGRRRRASFEESAGWWRRVKIETMPDATLKFTALTDMARAEEFVQPTQRALVERFVREAIDNPRVKRKEMHALFELVVPNLLKARAADRGHLQLIVDEGSAAYPWEMMFADDNADTCPAGLQAGLLRQLSSDIFREHPVRSSANRALVVGVAQPGGEFASLSGVTTEIRAVEDALSAADAAGFAVVLSPDESPKAVITRLHDGEYRLLHLAGHGVHEHEVTYRVEYETRVRKVSGMVLEASLKDAAKPGGELVLLTPNEIRQMTRVPELVFINCCHLGAIEARGSQDLSRHNALAANLATEFIRMGVRAVVAAGWAVDDAAASVFADAFYRAMGRGITFGDAVRTARNAAWAADPESTTWAAYQCYGDPAYRFRDNGEEKRESYFLSASEAICEILAVRTAVKGGSASGGKESLKQKLDGLVSRLRHDWLSQGELQAALGAAYAELGCSDQAIEHYRQAQQSADGCCTLRDLDQLANLEARHAESTYRGGKLALHAAEKTIDRVIKQLLARVHDAGESTDRCTILASAYKLRLMLCEAADDAHRAKLLAGMSDWYHKVSFSGGEIDPYPALNWLAAGIAFQLTREQPDEIALGELRSALAHARQKGQALYAANPTFWNGVHEIDSDLLEALLPKETAAATPVGEVATELGRRYRELDQRFGSVRAIDSVSKQIRFLATLLPANGALQHQRSLLEELIRLLAS